ncbi:MAG: hypothetical protein K2N82_01710, partial [Lachnospiraceae bacterium]|nr:hypothetical protein [Lachnospiraceae bacterium]
TIFMGDVTLLARHGQESTQNNVGKKSIFAGGLNKAVDPILQKKQQAQKQAMKVIGDTWAGDRKIDDDIDTRKARIKKNWENIGKAKAELNEISKQRDELRDRYGVEEDSQEEQDLKLLEKEIDAEKPGSEVHLTKEEREQIEEIKRNGLTEYQTRSLEMKKSGESYETEIDEAEKVIKAENAVIASIKLERLKKDPMVGAQRNAEEIIDAARDEILGMLIDEGKDHIDEEMEEKKEAAEKAEEKKEEQEEKIEKKNEKEAQEEQFREQIKDSTELMTKSDELMDDVQRKVKKILDEMKLLEEDLKGAAVDTVG